MIAVEPAPHEFSANAIFDENGLTPYFAADARVKEGGGSQKSEFTIDGERWVSTLYYQESGFCLPDGGITPGGTTISLDTIREFRINVERHPEEDPIGEESFNAHIAPRWQGMEVEKNDGTRTTFSVPEGLRDAVNVRLSGSNIAFDRYLTLLQEAAAAVGINGRYFSERDLHEYSNLIDAERYVRIDEDRSGPIHARDGPIASMGHLLENDRSGYRSVTQNDADEHGNTVEGYYHTATIGPERVTDLFPDHTFPREVKHYYAREAFNKPKSDPLAHPKVGVSYQTSRWDRKLGWDDLADLERQLDQTLLSVIADAGIPIRAGNDGDGDGEQGGNGPFVPDQYFSAVDGEIDDDDLYSMDLTQIRNDQNSVVIRHIADGLSPVEWESLETLVTDGGGVSPKDIAETHDRHEDSVRRALNRIDDLVEREYGSVSLRSSFVADLVHEQVKEARDVSRRAVEAGAKAIHAAERGLDEHTSAFIAWAAKHGIDVDGANDARMKMRLGKVDGNVRKRIEQGYELWRNGGKDPDRFLSALATFQKEGRSGGIEHFAVPVWELR